MVIVNVIFHIYILLKTHILVLICSAENNF